MSRSSGSRKSVPRRARRAEPAPINWDLRIAEAIADERQHVLAVLAEAVVELADRQREAIDTSMRPLRIELAELNVSVPPS